MNNHEGSSYIPFENLQSGHISLLLKRIHIYIIRNVFSKTHTLGHAK